MEGAAVSASMGVISPLLDEITILCADMPEGRARKEMLFFHENLMRIKEMVSSLHAVKMSDLVEEDTLLKKRWAKQAREIAYDTQDFIDLFRHSSGLSLSDETAGVMPKTTGRLKMLRRFSRRPKKLRLDGEMVNKIEDLKVRMTEVIERHKRFKLGEPSSLQEADMACRHGHEMQSEAPSSSASYPTVSIEDHLSALYAKGDGLVGIDGPRDELIRKLLMDDKQQSETKVVSILGPEGIGKTTLAQEVYTNIQGKFECRAFVTMSQNTGIQGILQAFRSQFSAQDGVSIEPCQDERLTHKLIQVLKGKRYFVVLDGMWSTRAWRLIRCALPGNHLGSRILVTTCMDGIAMSCCSTAADSIYRMKYLPEEEGKRLFIERTFGLEEQCPSSLEKFTTEILRKCGGWPILILAMASLLASKSSSEEQRKIIQSSIGLALQRPCKRKGLSLEQSEAHSCDSLQGVKDILYICYNDLPQHLKTCLLYLSTYPEGYVICRDRLVRRWIAEGFISVRSEHETLEEVGQCYFNELTNRGMIQPVGIQYDGRIDACQVHNLIFSLIVSISAEENFVTLFDGEAHESGTSDMVRRLSLNYQGQQHFSVPSNVSASPIRSLTIFGSSQDASTHSNSRALRVFDLDVQGDQGKKYLGTIGRFFQLKYLRLQMSGVVELPEQIGELQFLETLDLTKTLIRKLPRSILRLWRLVYLLLCNVELPDGVGEMRSLEELSGIQVNTTCSTSSLLGVGLLTKLRTVQLIWSISDVCSDIKCYQENLVSSLKELAKLQSLCIESIDGSSLGFLDSCSPHLQHVQKLCLTGRYYFTRIPERMISLVNLDFLEINVYQLEDEMMDVFGSLPALLVLSLSSQMASPEQSIVVHPGLFPYLKKFTLTCLTSWTGLVIEPQALPKLARLQLLCYVQGQRDPLCADYGIKYLSSIKTLCVEITFGGAGIWEVATKFPRNPIPQVEISDEVHMVEEEAEIIDKVGSLFTQKSFEKVMDHDQVRELEVLEGILRDASAEPIKISYGLLKTITRNFSNEIGHGSFGNVYRGGPENLLVAVKKISNLHTVSNKQFMDVIKCLKSAKHKNIVRFLGYCAETDEEITPSGETLVMAGKPVNLMCFEYVPNGNIRQYLAKENPYGVNWPACYRIIRGICHGLNYLHDRRINHLDLKPENVMLDDQMEPKITDFGLTRIFLDQGILQIDDYTDAYMEYIAPEIIINGQFSFKTDVYALGIIITELLTARSMQWHESLDMDGPQRRRCAEIARKCTHFDKRNRPTMREVITDLDELESMIPWFSISKSLPISLESTPTPGSESQVLKIPSRSLAIPFVQNPKYWRWIPHPDARSGECAELLSAYDLKVSRRIEPGDLPVAATRYTAYLVYKLADSTLGLEGTVQTASIKSYSTIPTNKVSLHPKAPGASSAHGVTYPVTRGDGWLELRLGEFCNEKPVFVELLDKDLDKEMSGLIIDGMEIRIQEALM